MLSITRSWRAIVKLYITNEFLYLHANTGHAPLQDMLHYRTCSTTGHAPLQDMFQYRTCSTTGHAPLQDMLHYRTCSTTGHAPLQDMFHYRTCSLTLQLPSGTILLGKTIQIIAISPPCSNLPHLLSPTAS